VSSAHLIEPPHSFFNPGALFSKVTPRELIEALSELRDAILEVVELQHNNVPTFEIRVLPQALDPLLPPRSCIRVR